MRIRMEDVVTELNLSPLFNRSTLDIECPECGNNCLHFDFGRQIFACPCCDIGGGIMDAWAYFRGVKGSNPKETRHLAKIDLEEHYGNNPSARRAAKQTKHKKYVKPASIATLDERDKFFRKILSELTLYEKHHTNLKKRGMNEAQVRDSQIKSFRKLSSGELKKLFPNQNLSKYPGFYMKENEPVMVDYGSGMMIPEISLDGRIQGFQIRSDAERKNRYLTLSSAKYGGASGPTFVHYANWNNVPVDKVIITEGPLKGALINYFTGDPVLAIPGVSSQKYLIEALEKLKELGLREVEIAFDMDLYKKEAVQKALSNLKKKLSDLEIPFQQLKWDKEYKGYDDYLAAKKASE